jgi:hypothetical protein
VELNVVFEVLVIAFTIDLTPDADPPVAAVVAVVPPPVPPDVVVELLVEFELHAARASPPASAAAAPHMPSRCGRVDPLSPGDVPIDCTSMSAETG